MKTIMMWLVSLSPLFSTNLSAQTYEVYVSDAGNFQSPPWKILKYDADGKNPEVFINTGLAWPQDILFLESSNTVLVSNLNSGLINRHDASTGAFKSTFASGIGGPTRMKIGPGNLLYVLQWGGNGKVLRYTLTGAFVDECTAVGVPQSIGLDWDQEGRLYVSSYSGKFVRRFSTTGEDLGLFVQTDLQGPTNIWFDANGDLLVTDYQGTAVKRFDPDGQYKSEFISGLSQAEGVAVYPDGHILIGNGFSHSVKLYDSEGQYVREFITNGSGGLMTPNAVVLREKTLSSTVTIPVDQMVLMPMPGRQFSVSQTMAEALDSFHVYDIRGALIRRGRVEGTMIWDAAGQPDGIYTLWLIYKNGNTSGHQVIVRS